MVNQRSKTCVKVLNTSKYRYFVTLITGVGFQIGYKRGIAAGIWWFGFKPAVHSTRGMVMFESLEAGLVGDVSNESSIRVKSSLGYRKTVQALTYLIEAKGLKIQAHVDHMSRFHSADGRALPKSLLLLGEEKGCVGSMERSLIDSLGLALSFVVFEDDQRAVWVTYNNVERLNNAAHINEHDSLVNGVANLMENIVSDLCELTSNRVLH